jgi:hypothetical protein
MTGERNAYSILARKFLEKLSLGRSVARKKL